MKKIILVVEDDYAIREMLGYALTKEGYIFEEASRMEEARQSIEKRTPDLILMDWMLPGISGVEYARRLRSKVETKDIPIIMLTAKGEETDKIKALDSGSDDYITKPFSTKELLARIRAVIRRTAKNGLQDVIKIQGLSLDPDTCQLTIIDNNVAISPTEFRLLHFFIRHPEKVYNRAQLLDQVWGQNVYVEERTVDVHIRRLRQTLEPYGFDKYIQTVRSFGYRFSLK
ncbi:MAG: two-component system phosphate regulon response regulator PhoB [Gammaproteobacteria bacterium]|jgi:two-component system phosphate regulon response regulator PhoB